MLDIVKSSLFWQPIGGLVLRFTLGGVAGRALRLELVGVRCLELGFALPSKWSTVSIMKNHTSAIDRG